NFCPDFMIPDKGKKNGAEEVMIDHMIMHLRHMVDVGGIECAAIGTDFDGIHGELQIPDASGMQQLFERMRSAGFTDSEVEKIARKNVMRVIGDSMK
nr:membrane dipeptidase [Eubacteriales bacterium]